MITSALWPEVPAAPVAATSTNLGMVEMISRVLLTVIPGLTRNPAPDVLLDPGSEAGVTNYINHVMPDLIRHPSWTPARGPG
jgi:hypothetical protein